MTLSLFSRRTLRSGRTTSAVTATTTTSRSMTKTVSMMLLLAFLILHKNNNYCIRPVLSQPRQQQQLQPIGDVLLLVFDQDHDQKVTLDEIQTQMNMLSSLFAQTATGDNGAAGDDPTTADYKSMIEMVQTYSSQLFDVLDTNGDKYLTKSEFRLITKFEQSMKKGGPLKPFVRDVFELIDINPKDDQLSVEELMVVMEVLVVGDKTSKLNNDNDEDDDDDVVTAITKKLHDFLPLRKTPSEMETSIRPILRSILVGKVTDTKNDGDDADSQVLLQSMTATLLGGGGIVQYIDTNQNGVLERTEVGAAYNRAGSKFLEISQRIKQMGPMLAMFGGGGAGGAGGMGGGMGGGGRMRTEL